MDVLSLIQPVLDSKDTYVPSSETGWLPMDETGQAFVKPLWSSPDSGGWAVLFHWKAGYVAPAHKHLGAIHAYIVSGKLQVRDRDMKTGDYIYEPNGILHEATTAAEDTIHLNIGDGPVLFYDEESLQAYFGWEQVHAMLHAPAE